MGFVRNLLPHEIVDQFISISRDVDEKPTNFFLDSSGGIAHGDVTFTHRPISVEVRFAPDSRSKLTTKMISPDDLTIQYLRKKQR